ncbi:hypothetical protein DM793_21360 [Paenarthrobacter nitroguajacolicus]|uniref:S-layer homology domain-containing protein n=1 Tax=Paenarthrobacter nitroguajacolicus TaxID=211146 RepID=UPI0015B92580|nr:S-layer homology domain-containing protein [Paenarthrobacter nitroguajacolicus]NWL13814.1 hypothetical protein [Paenarthrobacter nitroguajacolicus]
MRGRSPGRFRLEVSDRKATKSNVTDRVRPKAVAAALAVLSVGGLIAGLEPTEAIAATTTHRFPWLGESANTATKDFFTVGVKTYDEATTATDGSNGWGHTASQELWVHDRTSDEPGKRILSLGNGPDSQAAISELVTLGDRAYFLAPDDPTQDGGSNKTLWTSDGTAAGTTKLTDLDPGQTDQAKSLAVAGNKLVLFVNNPDTNRTDLWASDGTAQGTQPIVPNLEPDSGFSVWKGKAFYYNALNWAGQSGELWATDGTVGGTVLVANTYPDGSSAPRVTSETGALFRDEFTEATWLSNGTKEGTRVLFEPPTSEARNISVLAAVDDSYYFSVNDSLPAQSQRGTARIGAVVQAPEALTQGTNTGTILVRATAGDLVTAYDSIGTPLGQVTTDPQGNGKIDFSTPVAAGSTVTLIATRGAATSAPTYYDYVDGRMDAPSATATAAAGKTVISGFAPPESLIAVKDSTGQQLGTARAGQFENTPYFVGEFQLTLNTALPSGTDLTLNIIEAFQDTLWCTTDSGTTRRLSTELQSGSPYAQPVPASDGLYIAMGTNQGTVRKADCANGSFDVVYQAPANHGIQDFRGSGSTILFNQTYNGPSVPASEHKGGLWGMSGGQTPVNLGRTFVWPMLPAFGKVFFPLWETTAADSRQALWVSDGTQSGTTRLQLLEGTGATTTSVRFSDWYYSRTVGESLWFLGSRDIPTSENSGGSAHARIWATDGTDAGTQMVADLMMESETVPVPVFSDVPVGAQFSTEIAWMATQGISTGWTEADGSTTFRPLSPVNRDAMAAFMYRLAGKPPFTPPTTSPFTDVPATSQFYKEITWLAAQGISTGWTEADGSKSYRPVTPVNRDAMAAFMYRLAGKPPFTPPTTSPFTDVPATSQFYKEITWLAAQGISTGWTEADGSKTYRPLTPVNRDAMAAFMYRYNTNNPS